MTTIIRMKYTNSAAAKTDETSSNPNGTPSESAAAENIELLVNINCNVGLIMNYIREAAQVEPTVELDLWEESSNLMKNISSQKPHASGLEVFLPDHTYFLIAVKRDASGQIVNYAPMISGRQSRALSEVIAKIRRLTKKNSIATVSMSKLQDKGGRKRTQGKSK